MQAEINCNAAIFVRSTDVLVVDSHSKPSAAASLIAQIRKEVTPRPVRYVVNSHFHWDHTQGNHAYRDEENKIDFIASEPTKQLMSDLAEKRLKESLDAVPQQIDTPPCPCQQRAVRTGEGILRRADSAAAILSGRVAELHS